MLNVIKATPEKLYQLWPEIMKGLLEVKWWQGPDCHWEPEHVRAYVLANAQGQPGAEMWLCFNEAILEGFFVTTQFPDPYLSVNLTMFVWIAYAKGPGFAEGMAFLERLARTRGLRTLETISPRAGEERLLEPFGWYPAQVTYRKDLITKEDTRPCRRTAKRQRIEKSEAKPEESRMH